MRSLRPVTFTPEGARSLSHDSTQSPRSDRLKATLIGGLSLVLIGPVVVLDAPSPLRPLSVLLLALAAALTLGFQLPRSVSRRTIFLAVMLPGLLIVFSANLLTGGALSHLSMFYLVVVLLAADLVGLRHGILAAVLALVLEVLTGVLSWGSSPDVLQVTYVHAVTLAVILMTTVYVFTRDRFSLRSLRAVNALAVFLHREETPRLVLEALTLGANEITGSQGTAVYSAREGSLQLVASAGAWPFTAHDIPELPVGSRTLDVVDDSGEALRLVFVRPHDLDAIWPEVEGHFRLALQHAHGRDRTDRQLHQLYEELRQGSERLSHLYLETIEALVTMLEQRDSHTAGHSRRVAAYAMLLGQRLGMDAGEVDSLRRAAIVHDIGKIALPDGILLKPGPLTDAEWTQMKRHPGTGVEILKRVPGLADLLPAVHWHHERWDGRGYPDGLKGLEIPLSARVLAVADAFDAITSTRSYREARSVREALAILREGIGSQWCLHCAGTFVQMIERGEIDPLTVPEADVRLHG